MMKTLVPEEESLPLQGPGVLRRNVPSSPWRPKVKQRKPWDGRLIVAFVFIQYLCQLALLSESLAPARILFRVVALGSSLLLLLVVPGKGERLPGRILMITALGLVCLSFIHPMTVGAVAGIATLGLYGSIAGPVFWVPRLKVDAKVLEYVLLLMFVFNTASAAVGLLQVYFPGRFQPALSAMILTNGEAYAGSLQFETASGARIFRPMGLTDVPGGAANGGFFAALLGTGFFLRRGKWWKRALMGGAALIGVMSIYLSQVRSTMVILVVCVVAMAALLSINGRVARLSSLAALAGVIAFFAFGWAAAVGGKAVVARWSTLFESDASTVYNTNRGRFLEDTFVHMIPEYPFGAGLGRYGMVNAYFGRMGDPNIGALYAEIQWTAWLYDGGVVLMLLYACAILITGRWAFWLGSQRIRLKEDFWLWGSIVFAYDVGSFALLFSYAPFLGQSGLEFWLLNATLFTAWMTALKDRSVEIESAKVRKVPSLTLFS